MNLSKLFIGRGRVASLEAGTKQAENPALNLNALDDALSKLKDMHHDINFMKGWMADWELAVLLNPSICTQVFPFISLSKAQNRQDIFALATSGMKRDGFFVDFGATNGFDLSNSFLLENSFGWSGILAEPAKCWHTDLIRNRSCAIDTRCVWNVSGAKISFTETEVAELSTLSTYLTVDGNNRTLGKNDVYDVETVTLNDLLAQHSAPAKIDLLSLDTEGTELDILNSFDFEKYSIHMIVCEHNFTNAREEIHRLLTAKGFKRQHEQLSKWDDWYVNQSTH